ncbi:MAG: lipopolysaccharide biosynthesis protein [Blastocatellia bacterium]|nr:lipopolysaccharide biosynthesis protein [Blastocatellia bacterium]
MATALLVRAARGALWSWSAQLFKQLLQLGIMAILARWLTPADFGRVAMIGVVTGFLNLFSELGIGHALIQKRELKSAHLSAAFWGSFVTGLALMLILMLSAPLVAVAYADALLVPLTLALAANFPLVALATVPLNLLQRELRLGRLALVEILALGLGGAVAISLAFRGGGAWSLVGQTLVASGTTVIAAWGMLSVRPQELGNPTRVDRDALRELLRFGRPLMGINVLNYIARNADNALIGRFLGAQALGYYALAYRLLLFPLQNISWALGRALFPALARVSDMEHVRVGYRRVVEGISLVAFPTMIGMAIVAPELIRLLYGPQWERAIFLARVFCVIGALQAIGTTIGPLCLSQGRPDVLFRWNLIFTPAVVGAIALGLRWGIEGVALAYASVSVAAWYFSHALANRIIALPMRVFLRALAPAAASTFIMAGGVISVRLQLILPRTSSDLAALALQAGLGASLYAFALSRLRPSAFRELRELLRLIARREARSSE